MAPKLLNSHMLVDIGQWGEAMVLTNITNVTRDVGTMGV